MADNIKVYNTENKEIADISKDTIHNNFETTLIGEGVEDYIVEINTNFVKLLENFAGESLPPKAQKPNGVVEGQIWFDSNEDALKYRTSNKWQSNADKISDKSLDGIREFVLSGLDTTGKLSKIGGVVSGEMNVNGAVQLQQKSITPNKTESSNLGGQNNRFRNIYLKEDGIILGEKSKNLQFHPYNFVYVVTKDSDRVDSFPTGAIILHQETGEAIIKKSTGVFSKNNNTFRKLADDRQNSAIIGGNKFLFMGDIGLIAGGWGSSGGWSNRSIEKINITTPGNGSFFGNLTLGRSHMGSGMSSGTRGVFQGGWSGHHGSHNGKMDYVTFVTPGNATYFGTLGYENYGSSSVSDGTRGVIGSGYNHTGTGPRGHHYIARYITIETLSNAEQFGTIKQGYWGSALSSGTRGIFGGRGRNGGWNGRLEYITIQTPRNSVYFGSTNCLSGANSVTDAIKGVYIGGRNGSWLSRNIDYVTIATPSNGQRFGTARSRTRNGVGISNGSKGLSCSAWWNNTIEYITIQTPMNTVDFGNMTMRRSSRPSGTSGN